MKPVHIRSIPHNKHRYPTLGDYFNENEYINLHVSDLSSINPHYSFLIALHELVELYLCSARGISYTDIDTFDIAFEYAGLPNEPGDHPNAPYKKEHHFAELIERQMANELGIDWNVYMDDCDKFLLNNITSADVVDTQSK